MSETDTSDFLTDQESPSLWHFAGTEEPEPMYAHLKFLWATQRVIREAEADLAERLNPHLPLSGMVIDDDLVEPVSGAKRTAWAHDQLKAQVAQAVEEELCSDPGGNLFDRMFEAVWTMLSPNWKVRGLRQYGIDPSAHCKTEAGRRRVRVAQEGVGES